MIHELYTLGYSAGWTPELLREKVRTLGAILLDIRANPTSIKPQWTKRALAQLLGTSYMHVPQLGNLNYKSGGPIRLANPQSTVAPIRSLIGRAPVILLCTCATTESCHRVTAARYLADAIGRVEVTHLPGPTKAAAPGAIKAITLTQPYASAVAWLLKRIETRSWGRDYRGPLAIHAGLGLNPVGGMAGLIELCAQIPALSRAMADRGLTPQTLPRGKVVAVAQLVDCVSTNHYSSYTHGTQVWQVPPGNASIEYALGDYGPDRFGWLLDQVQPLAEPITARGTLGLWDWIPDQELVYA